MKATAPLKSCCGVVVIGVGGEAAALRLIAHATDTIAASGVRVLWIDRGEVRLPPRGRTLHHLRNAAPAMAPDVLRGYLGGSARRAGCLTLGEEAIALAEWRALATAHDLLLMGTLLQKDEEIGPALPQLRVAAGLPAVLLIQAGGNGEVAAAGRAVARLREEPRAPRPLAFAMAPHDLAVAAELSRRWSLSSFGDAADAAGVGLRILEASGPLERPEPSEAAAPGPVTQGVLAELTRERVAAAARRITLSMPPSLLGGADVEAVVTAVVESSVGAGPLDPLLQDATITEVMVLGDGRIFVERGGMIEPSPSRFADQRQVMAVIERLLLPTGRRLDESSPAVDARLPDGSRLHAIVPPLAVEGPALTIRRFARDIRGLDAVVRRGMLLPDVAEMLRNSVRRRVSTVISGGTGSGKTTLLAALASVIDPRERIITIEDAAELRIALPHVVRLESRPPNIEGAGEVTIRELTRNALRMRPDRIIVGECRGAEALDMLAAMNTGHEGSLTTVHANGPRDALSRLETMALMAEAALPLAAIREQIARAISLIVQLGRGSDGRRRVIEIAEVTGMEGAVISLNSLALLRTGAANAELTGHRPRFLENAEEGLP